jgi:membrane-bound lytic murein transglycosylase B
VSVIRIAVLLIGILLMPMALAGYKDHPEAGPLVDELVEQGLDRERLESLLDQAKRQESILEAIARPAEKTLTWGEYRKIFIQNSRIRQGEEFWKKHDTLLRRAEQEYGVSRYIIMAILGVETRYGRHKGSYRVLDALTTLGFDYPPRASFFRKQLRALFLMEQEAGIDAASITGSYAGAMGFPQFIPSSYRAYAVDFDGDGRIDLVNSVADAIGSVANYFVEHGWRDDFPVAARARVEGDQWGSAFSRDMKPSTTLGDLNRRGVTALSCDNDSLATPHCFDLPSETRISPLQLEGENGTELWLGTQNFYVITRYNHSPLYAMAVYQLSRELESRLEKQDP